MEVVQLQLVLGVIAAGAVALVAVGVVRIASILRGW